MKMSNSTEVFQEMTSLITEDELEINLGESHEVDVSIMFCFHWEVANHDAVEFADSCQ